MFITTDITKKLKTTLIDHYCILQKYFYLFWIFNFQKILKKTFGNRLVFYFKFFKQNKTKNLYFYKKNEYNLFSNELVLKRKFGLLKYKFNEKSYLLYKINSYLDLKKEKKKQQRKYLNLLRKKNVNKLFFKKVREPLFINSRYSTSRQFKKSKILYNLYNKKNDPVFNRFDSVLYTLISLKIFVNYTDALFYLTSVGFYCNSNLSKNPLYLPQIYDLIQLKADFYYFYYLKNMDKHFKKHFKKVKPRIYKLVRGKYDLNKQSATSIPKWVLNFKTFKEFKPNNIEYDLTIFSFIVLYKNNYQSIQYSNNSILSLYMYRLYNWRYIV